MSTRFNGIKYGFSLWKVAFPPVDADAGVNSEAEGGSKVSIENEAKDSDTTDDSSSDVDSKKKPKKEKIGFRDRKVPTF